MIDYACNCGHRKGTVGYCHKGYWIWQCSSCNRQYALESDGNVESIVLPDDINVVRCYETP